MHPNEFVALLREVKASAILRTQNEAAARPAMDAAVRGGFRVIEFTMNTPGAIDLIREFSARPGLVVGAGTVLSAADARAAVGAGAQFIVSPAMDPEVIRATLFLDVVAIPGCATPTEMLQAWRLGAHLVKLFPSPGNGPAWVRACLGPMPFLRIVPTNGVDATNAKAWLDAGAWAVGFTTSLFDAKDLEAGHFERVEERARTALKSLSAASPGG